MAALGLGYIGDHSAGHLHGYERIAVDVGVGSQPEIFQPFAQIEFAPFRLGEAAERSSSKQAQAANGCCPTIDGHLETPITIWRKADGIAGSGASRLPRPT